MTDDRIGGWQVRADVLTGYCKVCGALLADITAHLAWHDQTAPVASESDQ